MGSLHIRRETLQTAFALAFMVLAVCGAVSALRGCMNQHDRPGGHGDISFSIAPGGGEVVFNAVGAGGRDLYRLNLKTHQVTRIAATPEYEVDPCVSPDGKWVVYAAGRAGDRADHLYLRSLDGGAVKQLTADDANDASPAFSPDGSLIVFARDPTYNWGGKASNWDWGEVLYVVKPDGTGLRPITVQAQGQVAAGPHFSPDGKTILFCGTAGWSTIAADGSTAPKPLGKLDPDARWPVYSPDGRSLAYSSAMGRYARDERIFVSRADGSRPRQRPHLGYGPPWFPDEGCSHPAFLPDGKRLLFFIESWPDGLSGFSRQSLWEIDETGTPQEVAPFRLFDEPLGGRP